MVNHNAEHEEEDVVMVERPDPPPNAPAAAPVHGVPVPAPPPPAPTGCALTMTTEKPQLAFAQAHNALLSLVSLKAPDTEADRVRPPMDIVACIDRSGSMTGPKMNLMKQTLQMLVEKGGLIGTDRFGLVSFDHGVKEEIALLP